MLTVVDEKLGLFQQVEKKEKEEDKEKIVLKVDMHCDACARKIARSLKGFEGLVVSQRKVKIWVI